MLACLGQVGGMEVKWQGRHQEGCWYTCNFTFIYACEKSAAFPAPVFLKVMIGQQHYVQIPYTKLHPNWTLMWEVQM
jgi:hypothetical protein